MGHIRPISLRGLNRCLFSLVILLYVRWCKVFLLFANWNAFTCSVKNRNSGFSSSSDDVKESSDEEALKVPPPPLPLSQPTQGRLKRSHQPPTDRDTSESANEFEQTPPPPIHYPPSQPTQLVVMHCSNHRLADTLMSQVMSLNIRLHVDAEEENLSSSNILPVPLHLGKHHR